MYNNLHAHFLQISTCFILLINIVHTKFIYEHYWALLQILGWI